MDIEAYLRERLPGGQMTQKGWYQTICINPDHADSNPSFGVNLENGAGFCFSCRFSPDLTAVIQLIEGIGLMEAILRRGTIELRPFQGIRLATATPAAHKRIRHHEFWEDRGIKISTVMKFELGYDPAKQEVYGPIHNEHGTLIGHVNREIGRKQYINHGFESAEVLVGYHLLNRPLQRILVGEGLIDTYVLDQEVGPSVGRLGWGLSAKQHRLLGMTGATVVMVVDFDHLANRQMDQWSAKGYNIAFVERPYKDPGEMLQAEGRAALIEYTPLAWRLFREMERYRDRQSLGRCPPEVGG